MTLSIESGRFLPKAIDAFVATVVSACKSAALSPEAEPNDAAFIASAALIEPLVISWMLLDTPSRLRPVLLP